MHSFVPGHAYAHSTELATLILCLGFSARQSLLPKCAAGVSRLRPFCHVSNYRATTFWLQP
jgi:hypothetical protein